jgi:hypothetical protein
MAWIFQGNPKVFDIEDYVARYPELIYWRVPRYQSEIGVGDTAYIWRAGPESGVIASGRVVEAPIDGEKVAHPEALGDDLWFAEKPDMHEPKVGIALDSIRLTEPEGMLPRAAVKGDPILQRNPIITMPNSTVFRLDTNESQQLMMMWQGAGSVDSGEPEAFEGKVYWRAHRRRERSRFLVKKKLEAARIAHGYLRCEACGLVEGPPYPTHLKAKIFEVHHISPIASATTPRKTTLADLAVVCANCHRAIHATADTEENMIAIGHSR